MMSQILLCILLLDFIYRSDEIATNQTKPVHFIPKIDFYPPELNAVIQEDTRHVSFVISLENSTNHIMAESLQDFQDDYFVSVISENTNILEIMNFSYPNCIRVGQESKNFSFTVKGIFLGYTKVRASLRAAVNGCEAVNITLSNPMGKTWNYDLLVSVIRTPSFLVHIVTAAVAAFNAFNFINIGVYLDMKCIAKVLKKPIGPAIGFFCQFLFMPLASFGIGMLLLEDDSSRLGLFILGCSPGGSMSNFWTLLFNGDVNLSVTMTFISTVAALAMMPLLIFTLGAPLFREHEASIPYTNIVGSLFFLTVPLSIGLLIQRYSPRLSRISRKIIKPVTCMCALFGISVGLYSSNFVFKLLSWQVALAGIGVAWGGYSFGAFIAWLFRFEKSQIIAVSIETAFQNPAVPYVMLLTSLSQPEADLASVPVIAQALLTGFPMWVLLIWTRSYSKIKVCCQDDDIIEKQKTDTIHEAYLAVDTNIPDDSGTIVSKSSNK